MPKSGGVPLVSCGHCGKAYKLPADIPTNKAQLEEWLINTPDDDNWLPCIELAGMTAVEPLGPGNEIPANSGLIFYKPGNGMEDANHPDGWQRVEYMFSFGWDPKILWSLMKGKK
jgi:hypothetical protein